MSLAAHRRWTVAFETPALRAIFRQLHRPSVAGGVTAWSSTMRTASGGREGLRPRPAASSNPARRSSKNRWCQWFTVTRDTPTRDAIWSCEIPTALSTMISARCRSRTATVVALTRRCNSRLSSASRVILLRATSSSIRCGRNMLNITDYVKSFERHYTSIFGTLFERGLDPDKRSQLGAHYTDRDKIMLIVEPVIIRPWLAEWAATRAEIEKLMRQAEIAGDLDRAGRRGQAAQRTRLTNEANTLYRGFLDRLRAFRVLDPACGSGNFLYLALLALKDIEHRVAIEAETLGMAREFPRIGPEAVKGIEINPYAAELARVTVWIGEIQWMRRNGFDVGRNPILKPLDTIECRDAILNEDGTEAQWPEADVVIGNPPFLGVRLLRAV